MADPKREEPRPIAEISHGPSGFEQFLENNQKLLIVIGLVLALGTGSWVVLRGMKEGTEKTAGADLVSATDIPSLQSVASDHPETQAAISSALLLSDAQWDDGQKDAAIATLRNLVATHTGHPAVGPATARLGSRLVEQGSLDEARPLFEDLSRSGQDAYLVPYSLISLGEIAKQQDKPDEAEAYFKQVAEDYPANTLSQIVSQQLKLVRFELPEEVDPPALEETPTPDPSTSGLVDPGTGLPPLGGNTPGGGSPLIDILSGQDEGGSDAPDDAGSPETTEPEGDAGAPAETEESDNPPSDEEPEDSTGESGE